MSGGGLEVGKVMMERGGRGEKENDEWGGEG